MQHAMYTMWRSRPQTRFVLTVFQPVDLHLQVLFAESLQEQKTESRNAAHLAHPACTQQAPPAAAGQQHAVSTSCCSSASYTDFVKAEASSGRRRLDGLVPLLGGPSHGNWKAEPC